MAVETGIIQNILKKDYERIYVGSNFCSQFFLKNNCYEYILEYAQKENKHVTVTIPIITHKDLMEAKNLIETFVEKYQGVIDEITVNDFGMLNYVSRKYPQLSMNIGRLMLKESRDPRVSNYENSVTEPALFSVINKFSEYHNVTGIELDEICKNIIIPSEIYEKYCISVYIPFCYITYGNICKYASVHKTIEHKFRPNCKCALECTVMYEWYYKSAEQSATNLFRFGRAIYSYKNQRTTFNHEPQRTIYSPFQEIIKAMEGKSGYENSGSTERY